MESAADIFCTVETRCRAIDGMLVLTFEKPRPRVSADVLRALEHAVSEAERRSVPFIVASASKHFAFGADLDEALAEAAFGRTTLLDVALRHYQRVMLRIRYASVPVVAAVTGVAVSGGCELLMHCARVVAHADSSIGLFESAAGVVPAGGGMKEFARRAATSADAPAHIRAALTTISAATIVKPAEAQRLGFLTANDVLVEASPLDAAIRAAHELRTYIPPAPSSSVRVAGREVLTQLRSEQQARFDRGEITAHQLEINTRLATILCGGDAPGHARSESELLDLERAHFLVLAQTPATQARFAHLRATGKPLAN